MCLARVADWSADAQRKTRFATAATIVAGANLEFKDAAEVAEVSGGKADTLSDVFRFNRRTFGGEILLAWPQRDRSAKNFHELLMTWKAHNS